MSKPIDATHQCSRSGLFYKQAADKVYVWSSKGKWIISIGGSLDGHKFIRTISPTQQGGR